MPEARMTPPEQTEPWVWLALIRRPQGRKGEVFADILTDFPEKFAERKRLWLIVDGPRPPARLSRSSDRGSNPGEVQLVAYWLHKGGVVLHFAGIDSISSAETLSGYYVAVPRQDRVALAEGEVYISDLIGCTVIDVSPTAAINPARTTIGNIEDVDRAAGPVPLLVVKGASGEILIPFAKSYLRRIDLEGRQVEMDLPEGLADLNTSS